ncbi:RNA-directed DNA polymerase, eukaryota, partial [Tanacetum coccineum]
SKIDITTELGRIDKVMDSGVVDDAIVLHRLELKSNLLKITEIEAKDRIQKSKVKWAVEGDENSKFFRGILNKRRSQLAIRGVFVDSIWRSDPDMIKNAFFDHFEARFKEPAAHRFKLNFQFHKKLLKSQADDLEIGVSRDEIRRAVWSCGDNKSPGPDGYTFEFFKKYWDLVGSDFCDAVEYFFVNGSFSKGCNSSFVALIPKVIDAKFVNDFRPISLIGCVYKVVTKVLAIRLVSVIGGLVSDTQSAFVAGRQILDGPFILDEILHWCKRKKNQAMFFKVDFAKAYDSVRWDYLLDVLKAFGFGHTWCNWIRGILSSTKASILVNGSPSKEFSCYRGLKQGDPLAPYLFILVMESLHLSFSRAVDEGLFKGIQLPGSISISHLFYADDAMFIGEWSDGNLKVGVSRYVVEQAASSIGCSILNNQFRYLGVMVGECSSRLKAWDDIILKLRSLEGEISLHGRPPRLFALELDKEASVAIKLNSPVDISFRRNVRGGLEQQQIVVLNSMLEPVSLSNSCDRWFCDLTSDSDFRVKEVRNFIDDLFIPSQDAPTRWVKFIPIKVNVFAWRAQQDCLPTRVNLVRRGISIESSIYPVCFSCEEDINHILFRCDLAQLVLRRICRWWDLDLNGWSSFQEWQSWLLSIRLSSKVKSLLEGVFFVAWWSIWRFRNRSIFEGNRPRRSEVFDDIVFCAFNWCNSRCRRVISWVDWLKNPHLISL